jgi:hemoglobin
LRAATARRSVSVVTTVYEAAGGAAGMLALAGAWHERVLAEIVSHAFSHGFREDHTERLAAYWAEALGGPAEFSALGAGETEVVRLHSGNGGPHDEMNERAIACFDQAMIDVGIGDDDQLRTVLHDYFAWATVTVNRFEDSADDVPDALAIPHWSWDGRVADQR